MLCVFCSTASSAAPLPTHPGFSQYPIYHDESVAAMKMESSIAFDPTVFSTQTLESFSDLSLSGVSAPEFAQVCSSYSTTSSFVPTVCYVSQPPFDADMGSYDFLPLSPSDLSLTGDPTSKAEEEWLSLFPDPSLETIPSHPNSIYPASTPVGNNVASGSAFNFDFSNINSDFHQLMQ